jgi:hypothetical protein
MRSAVPPPRSTATDPAQLRPQRVLVATHGRLVTLGRALPGAAQLLRLNRAISPLHHTTQHGPGDTRYLQIQPPPRDKAPSQPRFAVALPG